MVRRLERRDEKKTRTWVKQNHPEEIRKDTRATLNDLVLTGVWRYLGGGTNDFSLGFTGLLGYTEQLNGEASPVFDLDLLFLSKHAEYLGEVQT